MSDKNKLDKIIGQRIQDVRLENGDSQTGLAHVLGFESPTAVSLIESGDRSLKIRDLIILCQLYQKDYEYFLGPISFYTKAKLQTDKKPSDTRNLAKKLLKVSKIQKLRNKN